MEYKSLLFEKFDGIAVVTLNRPAANNTLNIDLMQDIEALADELRSDLETRAVVFTGAGKNFCLGADVLDPKQHEISSGPVLKRVREFSIGPRMITKLNQIPQITTPTTNGISLEGGQCANTLSALYFRIGAYNCRCGLPEINLGMNLSWLSLPLIVNLIGPAKAKRFVILSRNETAQTLYEWGWLDEVAPAETLMERAVEMAKEYAAIRPYPRRWLKEALTRWFKPLIMPSCTWTRKNISSPA